MFAVLFINNIYAAIFIHKLFIASHLPKTIIVKKMFYHYRVSMSFSG